jgi:hypothetical protein
MPPGSDDEVIDKSIDVADAATTGRETVVVADCTEELESTTVTAKEKLPAVVGVPEIAPEAATPRPGASWPEDTLQVYGAVPPVTEKAPL